ncbi:MAG: hypothetical protein LBM98_03300 [Oscillospiraceae bacterium]|jgi:hypothetical protein|nr:hypothetical protein [Oscillospiraceae bacterium]
MKKLHIKRLGHGGVIFEAKTYSIFQGSCVKLGETEADTLDGEDIVRIKTVLEIGTRITIDIAGDAGLPGIFTLQPNEFWYMTANDALKYDVLM